MHKGEKELHDWVFRNVMEPRDRLDRVENVVLPGMFDANFCIEGREGWIEYKAPDEVGRVTTPLLTNNHKFLISQRNWALSQNAAGGRCFVLIGSTNHRMLIPRQNFRFINESTLQELIKLSIWHMPKGERPMREFCRKLRYTLRDY